MPATIRPAVTGYCVHCRNLRWLRHDINDVRSCHYCGGCPDCAGEDVFAGFDERGPIEVRCGCRDQFLDSDEFRREQLMFDRWDESAEAEWDAAHCRAEEADQ